MDLRFINLAVRFLLELCTLAALGYWGFVTGNSLLAKIVLGVGAPLLAAVLWGLWVAPKADRRLPDPARQLVELVVFGAAVAALFAAGRPTLAWLLAVMVTVNLALMWAWGQRGH